MDIRTVGESSRYGYTSPLRRDDTLQKLPLKLPPYNNMKMIPPTLKGNKVKDSFLLRNVYKNNLNTKMLLAKRRRQESVSKDNVSEGTLQCLNLIFQNLVMGWVVKYSC
jgi:hypothetical protein